MLARNKRLSLNLKVHAWNLIVIALKIILCRSPFWFVAGKEGRYIFARGSVFRVTLAYFHPVNITNCVIKAKQNRSEL